MKRITKVGAIKDGIPEKKLRVAAYARVSTGSDEQLLSLETQKAHYESLITSEPEWEFAGLYFDEGVSGTKVSRRTGLLELLEACEKGRIDRVLTKSISRFARNTAECLEMVRRLGELGVTIFFEKENIDTGSMESELMLAILSGIAESESVSISENEKWSIQKRFRDGTYILASTPYGYKNEGGEMAVVPEEAEVVKRIFREALGGAGTYMIAKGLNRDGIPSKKGKTWSDSAVKDILRNEKYTGDALFQKTYTDSSFNRHENRGEVNRYYVENHHEPVVSREDYDRVQTLLDRHAEEKGITGGKGKYNSRYAFSGIIQCGECGSTFKRRIVSQPGGKHIEWCCRRHIEDRENCGMLSVREDSIKDAFTVMTGKLKAAGKQMLLPLIKALEDSGDETDLLKLHRLDDAIEENRRQEDILTELMTAGVIEPAVFAEEKNSLASEASSLNEQKKLLAESLGSHEKEIKECRKLLDALKHVKDTGEFDERFFSGTVEKITIRSRNEFVFSLKCGLKLTERTVN